MAYVGLVDAYRRATGWPFVAAGLLGLAALVEMPFRADAPFGPVALVLALAAAAPVALVRVQPVVAAALAGAPAFLLLAAGFRPPVAGLVAFAIGLHMVARRAPLTALALLAPFLGYLVVTSGAVGVVVALAGGAALAGVVVRDRIQTERRLASTRVVDAALLRDAAHGERARIAHELHDVVAHHISMIAVQAETARLTTAGLPDEGGRRLAAIGDTARAALTEMRRLLGVLREDTGPTPPAPDRRPQPGLGQLAELVDEARDLSVATTRLIVRGRVAPLDPGLELIAYRIVQEALTNARRHAPGAAVDVELDYRDDALWLRVRDNGPGSSTPDGHGLTGMRERVAAVGGALRAGSHTAGGFLIEAILPTGAGS